MERNEVLKQARAQIFRPLHFRPQSIDGQKCFCHVYSNERSDMGGHQCNNAPKYQINGLQFCKRHAKQIDLLLEHMQQIDAPLYLGRVVVVSVTSSKEI